MKFRCQVRRVLPGRRLRHEVGSWIDGRWSHSSKWKAKASHQRPSSRHPTVCWKEQEATSESKLRWKIWKIGIKSTFEVLIQDKNSSTWLKSPVIAPIVPFHKNNRHRSHKSFLFYVALRSHQETSLPACERKIRETIWYGFSFFSHDSSQEALTQDSEEKKGLSTWGF